ncbi:MAG: O-antigen ligase family protein [Ruminococcaceae bacterium]|nr:O-antigen ligase family protein [Oscillospiraceae bacterium]
MRKNKVLIDLSMFLYLFLGFFSFFLGNGYYWIIICLIPISLYIINAVVSMDKENYGWVIFIGFVWISSMVSVYTSESYKYLLVIGSCFLAKLIFESVYGWHMKFSRIIRFFVWIHVLAVIASYFFPDYIRSIMDNLYTGEALDDYSQLLESNAYAGLTSQTGFAAFFISIFIAFCISDVLNTKLTLWKIIKIAIAGFALVLTVKRSFIVSNIIAILFVFYIQNKGNKKFVRNLMILVIVSCSLYYIASSLSIIDQLIAKNSNYIESGDITNGRAYLWEETYKLWLEKPIFGHGINVLPVYYGLSTHNSYLQILAEAGIFGFVSMIVAFIMSLVKSCSIYKDIVKDNLLTDKEKSVFLATIYMQVVFIVYSFAGNPMHGINFLLLYMLFISCIKSFVQRKD